MTIARRLERSSQNDLDLDFDFVLSVLMLGDPPYLHGYIRSERDDVRLRSRSQQRSRTVDLGRRPTPHTSSNEASPRTPRTTTTLRSVLSFLTPLPLSELIEDLTVSISIVFDEHDQAVVPVLVGYNLNPCTVVHVRFSGLSDDLEVSQPLLGNSETRELRHHFLLRTER